jgi:hypothetical protein
MPKRLRPSGGYRSTASFQTATLIYDATYWFCEKFLDPRSPRAEQMLIATPISLQLSSCTAYPEWIGTVEL